MAADLDLCFASAADVAARIARRELSAVEVITNALDRIEHVNPLLNCFCFVFPEEARSLAEEADRRVAAGGDLPPLLGVPIAIKDLTPTKGKRTTLGSYAFEHNVPDFDARIVERLRAAGAIMVGKTTTPEFAFSSFTDSPLWGITRNPWDTDRSPGGSSGGSGAAVASGCVALAEGTDMGGSVRIPASWCGIVGLKPSLGRTPMDLLPSALDTISHFGPLARTTDDARLFVDAAQGPDDRDMLSLPGRADLATQLVGDVRGMRIALDIDLGFFGVEEETEAAVARAADALRAAGAIVEEVDLPWTRRLCDAWLELWDVFMAAYFGHLLDEYREKMDPHVVALIERGNAMSAVHYKRIEIERTRQWAELAAVLGDHEALLCPTMSQPARPVAEDDEQWYADQPDGRYRGLDMTALFNNTAACPALSVPVGLSSAALPIGLQIVGRRHADRTTLEIGRAVELALGPAPRPSLP